MSYEYHLMLFVKNVTVNDGAGGIVTRYGKPMEFIFNDIEFLAIFMTDIIAHTTATPQDIKFEMTVREINNE